uniref:META domain-containing protein n=1 Tax=Gelidibacter sp. TaxID=2018083 RepID=UPI00404A9DA8
MKTYLMCLFMGAMLMTGCKSYQSSSTTTDLSGTWTLKYITGPRIAFDGLYPEKKPHIIFDLSENKISGNTSCNGFGGEVAIDGYKITIDKVIQTMIACEGIGEQTFTKALSAITSYNVENNILSLYAGDIEMMRFSKN